MLTTVGYRHLGIFLSCVFVLNFETKYDFFSFLYILVFLRYFVYSFVKDEFSKLLIFCLFSIPSECFS